MTPFILHHVTVTDFGIWVLAGSVVGYGSLLDFGVSEAVVKYIAAHRARGEMADARSLIATALCLYTVLGSAAIAASAILAPLFPAMFGISPPQRVTASWIIFVMGCGIGISIPAGMTFAILTGLQRFDLVNLMGVATALISAAATVAVLLTGGGLLGMVVVTVMVSLLMQVPMVWAILRIEPELRIGWRGASREQARSLVSFSLPIFAIYVAGRLQMETDNIVIGRLLSVAKITPYSLAQRLSQVGLRVTYQFLKIVLPLAAELEALNDRERLRVLYIASSRATAAIFIPIGCILIFLSQDILTVWVGQSYAAYSRLVVILTVASFLDTILWPAGSTLRAVERHQPLGIVALCSGVANLVLSIILVPHMGLTGVALGTLIPTAVESLGFVLPYAAVTLGISFRQVLGEIFLPALLPAAPMALILFGASQAISLSSLFTLIPVAVTGVLVYATGYLSTGASHYEREIGRKFMRDILHRIKTYQRPT